jgi:hypothetical protein
MRNLAIKPELLVNGTFTFEKTVQVETPNHTEWQAMVDVYFEGQRIAIINGLSAPLQWTAKNGSNIAISVIEELEAMVVRLIQESRN